MKKIAILFLCLFLSLSNVSFSVDDCSFAGGAFNAETSPAAAGGSGDVVGPASATDNAIARYDGTTGKLLQNSAVTVSDTGDIATSGSISAADITTTGSDINSSDQGYVINDAQGSTSDDNFIFKGDTDDDVIYGIADTNSVAFGGKTTAGSNIVEGYGEMSYNQISDMGTDPADLAHRQYVIDSVVAGDFDASTMYHQGRTQNFSGNNGYGQGQGFDNIWLAPTVDSYTHGNGSFAYVGGVYTGEYVYMCPKNADDVIEIDPATGDFNEYTHSETVGNKDWWEGNCFDGTYVWFAASRASNILKFHTGTKAFSRIVHGKGDNAFEGCTFTGEFVVMIASDSDDVVVYDPSDNSVDGAYAHGEGNTAYSGGVLIDGFVWLVPHDSDNLTKFNPNNGAMTDYAHGKGDGAFVGGVYDGKYLWLCPYDSDDLVRVDPSDGSMTSYSHGKGATAYAGIVYDGTGLWLIPKSADSLANFNLETNTFTFFAVGWSSMVGAIFDGESIWAVPFEDASIRRFRPTEFGIPSIHTAGNLRVGEMGYFKEGLTVEGTATTTYVGSFIKDHVSQNDVLLAQNDDAGGARVVINANNAAGDPKFNLQSEGSTKWAIGVDVSDGDKLKYANSASLETGTAVTIDTAEDVGIGTDNPLSDLHVAGILEIEDNSNNCQIIVDTDGTCDTGTQIAVDTSIALCLSCS